MTDSTTIAIRQRLQRTWRPFFGRFGNLTAIQTQTIPIILDGGNVVVMAPTASGKTEAVAAPVAELHRQEQWDGLAVLYVVPTRALANDTLRRVGGPIEDMGMRVATKHGDHPQLPNSVDWLITTPESLDSLICRHTERLRTLHAIILDEIHLIDATYRGDQLRVLLTRLQEIAAQPLHIHLISATLPDPDDIARRYTTTYTIVRATSGRDAVLHWAGGHTEVKQLAQANGWRKVLYFCNKREAVEQTAADLAKVWRPYPVVAHHGKLTRAQREEAEKVLYERRPAVGVATSTLEVGIDIGDIDLIVLSDTPWSVSALLQRIGRGSRRSGCVQVAALAHSPEEQRLLQEMFSRATQGVLDKQNYSADLSVIAQQAASMVFQNRGLGVTSDYLLRMLKTLAPTNVCQHILEHMAARGYLLQRGFSWFPSETLMNDAERGGIHSNIPDSREYRVLDVESGQEIGSIAGLADTIFLLARRAWQVIDIQQGVIRVRPYRGTAESAVFQRHAQAGQFSRFISSKIN